MNVSLRTAVLLFSTALGILSNEGVSLARTTGSTLTAELREESSTAKSAVVKVDIAVAQDLEARLNRARVCRISRHPRDGVPASVHACPLVFATADEQAPASRAD